MQRVFEFKLPKALSANEQNEMNLHGFYTNATEEIYYFSAFLLLVLLPFLCSLFPFLSKNSYLRTFMPRPFIGVIGAILCAYNYDMWLENPIQVAFFSSVLILCYFFSFCSDKYERYIILLMIILVVTSQILFLYNAENYSRMWEITEYKEFFIALALFVYSLDVFTIIKHKWSKAKATGA